MPLLTPTPTVAVIHGDGSITQYRPGSDGVTVHASSTMRNGPVDISLEFQSHETSYLRHTVPLRNVLEVLGLPDPYTLDALEVAWGNAEKADKCHAGDVLIVRDSRGEYTIWEAGRGSQLQAARVLSRAPRAPWAYLGDKLAVEMPGVEDEPRIEALAKALYCEHGVRVTGGEES